MMRILILGGYGVFGGRLIELVADLAELEILVGGRSEPKARAFCNSIDSKATLIPSEIDRADIANALRTLKPDIVVDASGPFQDYSGNPYLVVESCINAKTHYFDFADAADFVFGISQFDQAAKDANIVILSGVSSFPVLTAAVLRKLGQNMKIQSITGGIAPSPYAGIGLNVMRAVIGYAGGPVKLIRNGKAHIARGLTESKRYTIAPPGYLPLRNTRFSLVDVPDLQVIPQAYPDINDIWMGAGPVPEFLHRILNLFARMRAKLSAPSFVKLSPLFYHVLNLMKFGEHRGGMFIEIKGVRNNVRVTKSWHLLAEGDDGPFIPSMAIESILRKWVAEEIPEHGARAAINALELSDYDRLFKTRTIYTGTREAVDASQPIFGQILGAAFESLPQKLRAFHGSKADRLWTGNAEIIAATTPMAKLVARLFGFPRENGNSPVSVSVSVHENSERWTRNFDGNRFDSVLQPGHGKNKYLMIEQFGYVKVALALVCKDGRLWFIPRNWSVFGIPMPKFLMPGGDSFEYEDNGIFQFNVIIKAPFIGRLVSYRGWLKPSKKPTPHNPPPVWR